MARPATSPAARLRRLDAAKAKAAKLKRGTVLSASPMAELLGVSWPTLRDWCDDVPGFAESGVFTRGGNGVEWEFQPGRTIAFLSGHFKREQAASAKRARRVRQAVGGKALADVPDDYSLDELGKMVRLSRELREERERQGQLVEAEKVRVALRLMMSRIQSAALRAAQEQDPNGRWAPDMRESFENATHAWLLAAERAGQDVLAELNGGAAYPG